MRILWISDSPTTPSGFGGVTRAVCGRLARRGHRLEILGWQAHGVTSHWEGIPVRPVRHDQFGSDVLLGYLLRFRPDFLITLADVWWMSFMADPAVQRYFDQSGTRWAHYYPLDGADPEGRLPKAWRKVLEAADLPVAMSRFGVEVSRASEIDCAYVPHGCEVDLFAPPADRQAVEACKARLGYGGKFVVLSDARNQPRKLLPRMLDIAARFAAGKGDVVVHLHTDPEDAAAASDLYRYRLRQDVAALGLGGVVRFTENFRMRAAGGIPLSDLAALYAAADAHVLCSWGEGFGLPNLQAASAGVVPLAVAYSASRELVEGHGYAIPPESAVLDEFGLVRCLLSREAAVAGLDELYADPALLAERSRRSRAFALPYAWDAVVDLWERVLESAPPRKKPVRARFLTWTAGRGEGPETADLPAPVATAMHEAFATLPDGTRMSIGIAERRHGEVTDAIRRAAFVDGDELSLPVRLAPFFPGAPRARLGYVLVSPPDLPVVPLLQRVFPGILPGVPRPGGDPESPEVLPVEQLLPALLHTVLVLDWSATGAPHLDLACAALGIPYLGPSDLWPEIPAPPFHQARRLLTDQGLSEWRRQVAAEQVEAAAGIEWVERLRAIALAGQPRPAAPSAQPALQDPEMFLLRAAGAAAPDTAAGSDTTANVQLGELVARLGGLILMATSGGALIVTLPQGAKERLESSSLVGFIGPVHLAGESKAARALRSRFALNAARQLATPFTPPPQSGGNAG